jgi:hypothetical protein
VRGIPGGRSDTQNTNRAGNAVIGADCRLSCPAGQAARQAFRHAADVGTGQTVRICKAAAIACQAAGRNERATFVDRRHRMAERQCGELFAPGGENRTGADHEPACPQLDQLCKDCIQRCLGRGSALRQRYPVHQAAGGPDRYPREPSDVAGAQIFRGVRGRRFLFPCVAYNRDFGAPGHLLLVDMDREGQESVS